MQTSLKPVLMVVLVEAVEAVDTLQELVFLVKGTVEVMAVTGAAEAAEAAPEALEETQLDLMVVLEVSESLIQSLVVLYSTPEVVEAVEMEEVTELEVTVAEVLGPLPQMLLMEPEVVVLVSLQVQTLEELEAMV